MAFFFLSSTYGISILKIFLSLFRLFWAIFMSSFEVIFNDFYSEMISLFNF